MIIPTRLLQPFNCIAWPFGYALLPQAALHLIVLAIRLDGPLVEIYVPDALNASLASKSFPDLRMCASEFGLFRFSAP